MTHASEQRFTAAGEEGKKQAIVASEAWLEELKHLPFKSCKIFTVLNYIFFSIIEKNGKTLHLLKQSAKTSKAKKQRKIIPLLGSIQDYHKTSKNISVMS